MCTSCGITLHPLESFSGPSLGSSGISWISQKMRINHMRIWSDLLTTLSSEDTASRHTGMK